MTAQHDPPQGWGPTPKQLPNGSKARPFRAGFLGCFGVLAAVVVIGIVIAALASNGSKTKATPTTGGSARTNACGGSVGTACDQPTEAPAATAPPAAQPKPSDFSLSVKTLKKECFGSAGCNVTYRIQVAYNGPKLDPDTTYEVTYTVRGDESGPQINTMTISGGKSSVDSEEFASTKSSATTLKAVVTDVAEQ